MYKRLHIHFVGIGGIGMSGIAEVLLNLGYPVSGSDVKKGAVTARLKSLGADIRIGHREKNVEGADVVVYSSAVRKTNPELAAAEKLGIPVIRRAEMLSELMRLTKYGVAVAGTHGKTTTTSLMASALFAGGLDPTMVIGGKLNSLNTNAKLGRGDFMVVEADESDGSFLLLMPTIAVVTNMDPDHMENYGEFSKYREAFEKFCLKVPFYGLVVLCGEHPETKALAGRLDRRIVTYGFSPGDHVNARNLKFVHAQSYFDLYRGAEFIDHVELGLAGRHNVLNALAVIAVAFELGLDMKRVKEALKNFQGVGRRMEVLYKGGGVVALDDYGHHPAEILATLQAVRQAYTGRLVVLFQPHRYTRTQSLYRDFLACFDAADEVFITRIYSAGETPIKGVTSKKLAADLAKRKKNVRYLARDAEIVPALSGFIEAGDVFVTLGAGDVTKAGREVAAELKKRYKDPS
jgi:UDP-N-acetylmuramate--alanine ligase